MAGRKRAAGNREEEEAVQGRKAEATGQGGWANNTTLILKTVRYNLFWSHFE